MTITNNKRIHIVLVILAIATVAIASNYQKLQKLRNWLLAGNYFNNGVIYELYGHGQTAIVYYEKAIQLDNNFTKAREKLEKACNKQDTNNSKKKTDLAVMNKMDYTNLADYYNSLGNTYFFKNSYNEAITNYSCALGLSSTKNADFYYNRGKAYFRRRGRRDTKKDDVKAAIDDVKAGIELSRKEKNTASYERGQNLLKELQP